MGCLKRILTFCKICFFILLIILVVGFLYEKGYFGNIDTRVSDLLPWLKTSAAPTMAPVDRPSVTGKASAAPVATPAAIGKSFPAATIAPTAPIATSEATAEPTATVSAEKANGIRPEFKKMVDDLEAFFDEYTAFMIRYQNGNGSLGMALDYAKMMERYFVAVGELNSIGEEELTDEEDAYYVKALARINARLAEAALTMD